MDVVDKVIIGITAIGAITVGLFLLSSVLYASTPLVLGAIGALIAWVILIKIVLFWSD